MQTNTRFMVTGKRLYYGDEIKGYYVKRLDEGGKDVPTIMTEFGDYDLVILDSVEPVAVPVKQGSPWDKMGYCPNCGYNVELAGYCRRCGQRLGWSDGRMVRSE